MQSPPAIVSSSLPSRGNKRATALIMLLVCVGVLLPGCNVCQLAKRTVRGEPSEYWWFKDRKESVEVYRVWADNAWCDLCLEDPEQNMSPAYVAGFKDGFVDYVFAGGAGEPPPVPPRQYWNVEERNPRGHESATDWFAGFRHGAQLAKEEGFREKAIVPASIFLANSHKDRQTCAPNCQPLPLGIVQPELVRPMIVKPHVSGGNINPKAFTVEGLKSAAPATEPLPLPSGDPSAVHLGVPIEAHQALPIQPLPSDTTPESSQPFQNNLPGIEDNNRDVDEVFDTRELDFSRRQLRRDPQTGQSRSRHDRPRISRSLMTKPLRPRATARPATARLARTAAARTAAARARAVAKSQAAQPANEQPRLTRLPTNEKTETTAVWPGATAATRSATVPLPSGRAMGMSPQFSR